MQARIIAVNAGGNALGLDAERAEFYREAMQLLNENGVPFLVGGAYALCVYTGLSRHTKDIDLFIRSTDLERALEMFEKNRYTTERTFPHWLAKVYRGENFIDLIYAAGNGLCEVDESWLSRAHNDHWLGLPVKVTAPEEMIWMKAFIQERERYDGADIAHLLLSRAESIDWAHLRARFGPDWRVLFSHLILFGYIYPSERQRLSQPLLREWSERLLKEQNSPAADRVCRGTFLSRAQFLPDVEERGYRDARLAPRTTMTEADIEHWTAAMDEQNRTQVNESQE
jgi:predicted nucleotidyltransferase